VGPVRGCLSRCVKRHEAGLLQSELSTSPSAVSRAVASPSDPTPCFANVLLTLMPAPGRLSLTGFDLSLAIQTSLPGGVETSAPSTLPHPVREDRSRGSRPKAPTPLTDEKPGAGGAQPASRAATDAGLISRRLSRICRLTADRRPRSSSDVRMPAVEKACAPPCCQAAADRPSTAHRVPTSGLEAAPGMRRQRRPSLSC